jgi:putative ATPase
MMTSTYMPLAAEMRPTTLDEFYGQTHLLGENKPITQMLKNHVIHSMVFWGPPGSGKTTLAKLLAQYTDAHFEQLSAVLSGVKEIRSLVEIAKQRREVQGIGTVLFIDEIHRFNKSQQDAFLPHIEEGSIVLVGATTENPSFELNNALLSRVKVHVLTSLTDEDLKKILQTALKKTNADRSPAIQLEESVQETLVNFVNGDARQLLNNLEMLIEFALAEGKCSVDKEMLSLVLSKQLSRFDNKGEYFYDLVSALHKSVRGSNPDAALYWFARMMAGGCDPLFIARRVVRMASEDIGNADPRALTLALNAWDVQERLGQPEGELAIAQAIIYLASCAKSNAVYLALAKAKDDVEHFSALEVPVHLRNAPTKLMKELGYGKAYRYAHDEPNAYAAGENYFPEGMPKVQYYQPVDRGLESNIGKKLKHLKKLDAEVESR